MRSPGPQPDPLDSHPWQRPHRSPTDRCPHDPHPVLAIPDRIVNRAGRPTLLLPINWPWATAFTSALEALRTWQPLTG
jgi:hypothetical protein